MEFPRMNCVPRCVLDTEIGFTRKLEPAPKQVLTKIERQSVELRRIEAFRNPQSIAVTKRR
jgi:hypothetical protein